MKNNSYDKKIFRLIYILNKLDGGNDIKTSELATEFNVTQRTVQRDLDLLNTAGFPLVNVDCGHKFMNGFALKKIAVTHEEKFMLNLFYQLFSKAGTPFDSVAKEFINKTLLISKNEHIDSNSKITQRHKKILKNEIQELSKSIEAKLESSSYSKEHRKKIEEYLIEIEHKIKKLAKKKNVDIKFKRTGRYDQSQPVAIITVPKTYFKDQYAKYDYNQHEKNRVFEIKFFLPNKYLRSFRIVLMADMFFKFWGPYIKNKKMTCFDDFASYLGFGTKEKEFNYNASYGNDKGILITRASISWREEIPMLKKTKNLDIQTKIENK